MGSHQISFRREINPGLTDYQLAEKLSAVETREGAIIVRYKSSNNGWYDTFGSCAHNDMLLSYFRSQNCHDTEILYIHPLVQLDSIPSGLKITNNAPENSKVFELKQIREEKTVRENKGKKRGKGQLEGMILQEIQRVTKEERIRAGEERIKSVQSFFTKLFGSKRQNDTTEFVTCGICKIKTKVEDFDPKVKGGRQRTHVSDKTSGESVTIIGPNEIKRMKKENIALRCTGCGFIICFTCASSKSYSSGMGLFCPKCGKQGGPNIFTR